MHPLPERVVDYVWDYGSLGRSEEHMYISSIVADTIPEPKDRDLFIDLIAESQEYIQLTACVYFFPLVNVKMLRKDGYYV